MADSLDDATVGIFTAQRGTEQVEFTDPKEAVAEAGASVDVLGAKTGEVEAVTNDLDPPRYRIDPTPDQPRSTARRYPGYRHR